METDVVYVLKEGTNEIDPIQINYQYLAYMELFDELVKSECMYLESFSLSGIISDVSPLAFAVGEKLGIRTVGISNFTWAGAYKNLLDVNLYSWLLKQYTKQITSIDYQVLMRHYMFLLKI